MITIIKRRFRYYSFSCCFLHCGFNKKLWRTSKFCACNGASIQAAATVGVFPDPQGLFTGFNVHVLHEGVFEAVRSVHTELSNKARVSILYFVRAESFFAGYAASAISTIQCFRLNMRVCFIRLHSIWRAP